MSFVPYVVEQSAHGERSYDIFSRLLSLILSVVCVRSKESRSVINIASTAISAFWALLMVGIVALAVFLTFVQIQKALAPPSPGRCK